MDFDSSTKFISSLAKFLQSLCNGYVEFDSGVEVIGHIYLSVDTGKKIDYILNEKVCKTDENSVTFISNSFHAQPAEKPKPLQSKSEKPTEVSGEKEEKLTDDEDIILMDEPASTNTGTVKSRNNGHQQHSSTHSGFNRPPGASKRPYSHSSSFRPSSKHHKIDSSSASNPNGSHMNSLDNSEVSLNIPTEMSNSNLTAASEADLSHLSQVLPENVNDSSDIHDVKPVLDSDMKVKQEYDPSAEIQDASNMYTEQQDEGGYYSSMQSHDSSYDMGNNQYYGARRGSSHQSEYGEMGSGDIYPGGPGSGDTSAAIIGDSQGMSTGGDYDHQTRLGKRFKCPVPFCCQRSPAYAMSYGELRRHWREKHERLAPYFHCGVCDYRCKRKNDLNRHKQTAHRTYVLKQDQHDGMSSNIQYHVNRQYINPYPYTLGTILEFYCV